MDSARLELTRTVWLIEPLDEPPMHLVSHSVPYDATGGTLMMMVAYRKAGPGPAAGRALRAR
ncbi:hypothetical protein ABH935_007679 [Catenulispora sp. GAS73]|uniref:hypothetical protein n=1 Tax=Catenulispora sp. GAS73 TaxID=3156269 RepID=UPI003518D753